VLLGTQEVGPDGHLIVGGCDAVELARRFGTPLYVYDVEGIRAACRAYRSAFAEGWPAVEVAYACKAFSVGAMLQLVVEEGLGLDVVSEGELRLALWSGIEPGCVTLHGSFKTAAEIELALLCGVGRVVVDSLEEIGPLAAAARRVGRRQPVLVRLNAGVAVDTDPRYATGANAKFGLAIRDGSARTAIEAVRAQDALLLEGLHFHLGSQLFDPAPYRTAIERTAGLLAELERDRPLRPSRVVVGGGMAARYRPEERPPAPGRWAEAICEAFARVLAPHCADDVVLGIEPGRSIVAEHGLMLYTLGPIKATGEDAHGLDAVVVVDGGLSDNPRPLMYAAHHEVLLAAAADEPARTTVAICGRHCEPDVLLPRVDLPAIRTGDVVAVQSTGAYTHAMASNYNRSMRPAVVFVERGESRVVQRAQTWRDLVSTDTAVPAAALRPRPSAAPSATR